MKKRFYLLIVVGILFLITLFTCPDKGEHNELLSSIEFEKHNLSESDEFDFDRFSIVENYVNWSSKYKNYYVCSFANFERGSMKTFGIFGKVYVISD